MRRLAHWILVLALSVSIGLPSAFLQSAAWLGMIVNFAQQMPLAKAVAMTFDGKHPCKMCQAVERSNSSQKKQDAKQSSVKIELAEPEHDDFLFLRLASLRVVCLIHAGSNVSAEPPVPPPKLA